MTPTYTSELIGALEYRYGHDGSLTILDTRKRRGAMRTVLYVRNSPATEAYRARQQVI